MTKASFINQTLEALQRLPEAKVQEIAEFAEFLLHKYEEEKLEKGIEILAAESGRFDFLEDEEDLYTVEDLKERYQ